MYLLSLYYNVSGEKMFVIRMLKISCKKANFCNVACWKKIKEKQRKIFSGGIWRRMSTWDTLLDIVMKWINLMILPTYLNYTTLLIFFDTRINFFVILIFLETDKHQNVIIRTYFVWIIRHKLCKSCLYALKTILVSIVRGKTYRSWSCFKMRERKERERERREERLIRYSIGSL